MHRKNDEFRMHTCFSRLYQNFTTVDGACLAHGWRKGS